MVQGRADGVDPVAGASPAVREVAASRCPPVLLIVFRREASLRALVGILRAARPGRVHVFADGPRDAGDVAACERARGVVREIDWGCDVRTRFLDANLGCGRGPAAAISWFFEAEPEGIVLEDDLLPEPPFFGYCAELLERYRDDPRVMQVCGTNRLGSWERGGQDYHGSLWGSSCGWASWRRAWALYDHEVSAWADPAARRRMRETYHGFVRAAFLTRVLGQAHRRDPSVTWWDYQWTFAMTLHGGMALVPSRNLVHNVGNDGASTHDRDPAHTLASWSPPPPLPPGAPLRHPARLERDPDLDEALLRRAIRPRHLLSSWLPGTWKRRLKARLAAARVDR